MRWLAGSLLLFLASPLFAQEKPAAKPPITTYIHCGTLLDQKSDQARKDAWITVEDEKIKEVREGGAAAPAGAITIDLSKETCLPGLIDAHTHVLLQGDITAEDYDVQLLKQSQA